jgi:hypothetical protein
MPTIPIPFVGGHEEGQTQRVNYQLCTNLYPGVEGQGAKTPAALYPTPGMTLACETGIVGPCRSNGVIFQGLPHFIIGEWLVRIDAGLQATRLFKLATAGGRCALAVTRVEMIVVDGIPTYRYYPEGNGMPGDGTVWQILNGAAGPLEGIASSQVVSLDHTFIVNEVGSDRVHGSGLLDGFTWVGYAYATAEARPDLIVALHASLDRLFFLGEETTEVYMAAPGDFPFAHVMAAEWGCQAAFSLASVDGATFWLGRGEAGANQVFMSRGAAPQRISNHGIERILSEAERTDDAYAWVYQHNGQVFYNLSFPTLNRTFAYSVSTGSWHERSSSGLGRSRVGGQIYFAGKNLCGDALNTGKIFYLDAAASTDAGDTIVRTRTSPAIHNNGARVAYLEIKLDVDTGGWPAGADPHVVLRYSDDYGRS